VSPPHDFLMSRVWDRRANLSAYDAVYVALAEALDAPLLTRDQGLANAPGHRARRAAKKSRPEGRLAVSLPLTVRLEGPT